VPAMIEGNCSQCGARHLFFLPYGDLVDENKIYEFDCPYTGGTGKISFDEWSKVAELRPHGAVDLR
jgi:hypothetical protein